jgi:2-succinyl-6-hydroxy-2,4-cyclohexadiene-1-carboxylate synthase
MRVVALHGFANTHTQWDDVAATLPSSIELVPIALPGHVDGPQAFTTWSDNIAVLAEAILGRIAMREISLIVGYSLGARIALGLLEHGWRVPVVLVSAHPGLQSHQQREQRRRQDAVWIDVLRSCGIAEFSKRWIEQPLFASQRRMPDDVRNTRAQQRLRHDPIGLATALEGLGLAAMPDYRDVIAVNQASISLLVGSEDEKFCALAAELGLSTHVVDAVGHDLTMEAPRHVAKEIVRRLS